MVSYRSYIKPKPYTQTGFLLGFNSNFPRIIPISFEQEYMKSFPGIIRPEKTADIWRRYHWLAGKPVVASPNHCQLSFFQATGTVVRSTLCTVGNLHERLSKESLWCRANHWPAVYSCFSRSSTRGCRKQIRSAVRAIGDSTLPVQYSDLLGHPTYLNWEIEPVQLVN